MKHVSLRLRAVICGAIGTVVHVFVGGRTQNRRATLVVTAVVLALGLGAFPGAARSSPAPGSVTPLTTTISQGQTKSYSGFFGDSLFGFTTVPEPAACTAQQQDPDHIINCEHGFIRLQNSGDLTVRVTFSTQNDFDVGIRRVINGTSELVAFGLSGNCGAGCAEATVPAATRSPDPNATFDYEFTISPFFFTCPPGLIDFFDPLGGICPNQPFSGQVILVASTGAGAALSPQPGHKMTGSVGIKTVSVDSQLTTNVIQNKDDPTLYNKGSKVAIRVDLPNCKTMRSTQILPDTQWFDGDERTIVHAFFQLNNTGPAVEGRVELDDNGEPGSQTSDDYTVLSPQQCAHGGDATTGNLQYHRAV